MLVEVDPKTAFEAIATTQKVSSSLFRWLTGNKGFKRTVGIELKQNIELLKLWRQTEADPVEIIAKLSDASYQHAVAQGFGLNSLRRSKINSSSTKGVPHLERYHGWSTEAVFDNVYGKIGTLRHATSLKSGKSKLRLNVRLSNLYRQMVMLAIHIGG